MWALLLGLFVDVVQVVNPLIVFVRSLDSVLAGLRNLSFVDSGGEGESVGLLLFRAPGDGQFGHGVEFDDVYLSIIDDLQHGIPFVEGLVTTREISAIAN